MEGKLFPELCFTSLYQAEGYSPAPKSKPQSQLKFAAAHMDKHWAEKEAHVRIWAT